MNDITLVTSPDKVYSTEYTFLMIYPSNLVKNQLQDLIEKYHLPFVIYLYENDSNNHDPQWLLDVFYKADCVIVDVDNCEPQVRDMVSYFISKDKTFWLTNSGDNFYNVISKNRLFNLDFLEEKIGGHFEK